MVCLSSFRCLNIFSLYTSLWLYPRIAAGVILASELITPLVRIEHWRKETTERQETFELLVSLVGTSP